MPRGGKRVGAGRKPTKPAVVLGMDGVRRQAEAPVTPRPPISEPEREGLLEPPKDLSPAAQDCWREHAPKAISQGTLTPAETGGFEQLCEQWAKVEDLNDQINRLGGAGNADALKYLKPYSVLAQRLDASLARFKLTGFGKPATSTKPKSTANPFAAMAPR